MTAHARPRREPRIPLTRDRVLRAAIELADEGGIESLSMRRLGLALGVEAMSLYNHVANKDDLLVGMLDVVVGEMETRGVRGGATWKDAIRRSGISAHAVLVTHPWACRLLVSGTSGVAPARLRYMDAMLGCLRGGGFSVEQTDHAYHALDSHIIGFTLWQLSFPFENEAELKTMAGEFLRQLPVDDLPHLAEHVRHHLRASTDEDQSEFDFGLDLILDGLERIRKRRQPVI